MRSALTVAITLFALAPGAHLGVPTRADTTANRQWHLDYLKIADAHRVTRGEGVTVAVIDTGTSKNSILAPNIVPGVDYVDSRKDGTTDFDGHGTAMAGLIAATGRNDGPLGIAPAAKVMPLRVQNRVGPRISYAPAIDWAVSRGAKVINMSLGGGIDGEELTALRRAAQSDVVLIAAAGNRPGMTTVQAPASLPMVVAVGAVDRNGKKAEISVSGPELDLTAPGEGIVSTGLRGEFRSGTGTSDSAAIVSGAAALIRSKYPNLTAQQVVKRLKDSAIDKGPPGFDDDYGHGIIDINAALGLSVNSPAAPAPSAPSAATYKSSSADSSTEVARSRSGSTSIIAGALIFLGLASAATTIVILNRRIRRNRR